MTAPAAPVPAPPAGCYWVESGRLLAGAYPGHADPTRATRLAAVLALGIDWFIDLTMPGELAPYDDSLPSPYEPRDRGPVTYSRRPIPDHGLPATAAEMNEILDELDTALADGHLVYVHCRAGIGRTGTVIGCHLARRLGGPAALAELERLWRQGGRDRDYPHSPETDEQFAYVSNWRASESAAAVVPAREPEPRIGTDFTDRLKDRYRGLVLGLALGDALAAPVQHRREGSFTPVGDLTGGGPYELPRGAWSDDTAVAALLAESLIASGDFDPTDFVARLVRWQREGQGSATGQCVGISATTAKAIAQAQWSGNPFAGSHDPARMDKEPLVRAGIAAAYALSDPAAAIEMAVEVARPTHQSPLVLDACRYYAALVVGALQGATRAELTAANFSPVGGLWERRPLRREVARVAGGSWRERSFVPIADGTALDALAIVLSALARGSQYRDTVLAAVNLGLDADVNGALAGQLAGALGGASSLPPHWVAGLALGRELTQTADGLLAAALGRIAAG